MTDKMIQDCFLNNEDSARNQEDNINHNIMNKELQSLEQVLEFVKISFTNLNKEKTVINTLPLIHCKLLQVAEQPASECNINDFLCSLVNQYQRDDDAYELVLQVIYQILMTLCSIQKKQMSYECLTVDKEVMIMLIEHIFELRNTRHLLLAKVMACLQVYLNVFPKTQSILMQHLWLQLKANWHINKNWQILVELFDGLIANNSEMLTTMEFNAMLEDLLNSEQREERKAACYLMKKLLLHWENTMFYEANITKDNWLSFITIVENLEENQSHLIMPALTKLENFACINANLLWQKWLEILYKKLLMHNNSLVKRWSLEFVLKTLKWHSLRAEMQQLLLNALNTTNLYNDENYFLPTNDWIHFFSCVFEESTYLNEFFGNVAKINWKPVPLHFCLKQIQQQLTARCANCESTTTTISTEVLLKMASCVRKLQNKIIRQDCLELFKQIFSCTLNSLNLTEFCNCIETLYNPTDLFIFHECFDQQILNYMAAMTELGGCSNESVTCTSSIASNFKYFTRNFYEIIKPHNFDSTKQHNLLNFLYNLPKTQHGSMQFFVIFNKYTDEIDEFRHIVEQLCESKYNFDIVALKNSNNLHEIQEVFKTQLCSQTKDESDYINKQAINFFILNNFSEINDLERNNLQLDEFLDMISADSMEQLLTIFGEYCCKGNNDEALLNNIVKSIHLSTAAQVTKLFEIICEAHENLTSKILQQLYGRVFKYFNENPIIYNMPHITHLDIGNLFLIENLMVIDANKVGDPRIEHVYINTYILPSHCFAKQLRFFNVLPNNKQDIQQQLLALNQQISERKARYFDNSPEHHMHTRVAHALLYLTFVRKLNCWRELIWQPILEQNNQLNVTLLYEILIATNVPTFDLIQAKLQNINNYTASQQVSILSITYTYYTLNFKELQKTTYDMQHLVYQLLPLTMGANFQTRLYAQLFIYKLLEQYMCCESYANNSDLNLFHLKQTICQALGDKLSEFLYDIRVNIPAYLQEYNFNVVNLIGYITNAPIDEYSLQYIEQAELHQQPHIQKSKEIFKQKILNIAKTLNSSAQIEVTTCAMDNSTTNIQRKIQPLSNLLPAHNFLTYPFQQQQQPATTTSTNDDIYVIASLIDKLPNLGGIARSCEVFGIKNLVLNTKSVLDKSDFKNLSLTAEQYLNIIEIKISNLPQFLMQKQLQGFKVIGAEQVSNSQDFVNFQFPKKSIILLGHEKEGIPANLLNYLDYAVEIPQFGNVRSLNVHVTGALFMWEYCKQHIVTQCKM